MITNPTLNYMAIRLVPNESLSNSFFKLPKDLIHLSGKEEDHSFDMADKSNNNHDELILNTTGNSVTLFLEFPLHGENKIEFYFELKLALKQNIDQQHLNSNNFSRAYIDSSHTLCVSMSPLINVLDSIINFTSIK